MSDKMKTFNVGVLGTGDIFDVYVNNLKKYDIVNVLACAGRNLDKAQKKAQNHGIPRAYATATELIGDPQIDIVLNLTVPAVHAELTMQALLAGKHVYSEKPLAASVAEGEKILTLAKDKGRYVGCAPDTFLGGRLQTCRKIIDEGRIGKITAASAFVVSPGHEWHHPNPDFFYQPGGGPVFDIAPYYFTALLSLMGPVKSCSAMAKRTFEHRTIQSEPRRGQTIEVEVDTHLTANLEFTNGALATMIASYDVWDSELPRIELYGETGTICLNDIDPLDGPNLFGGPVLLRTIGTCRWRGTPRPPFPEWEEVPSQHQFNETSHEENSRGIGLVDMAYAIREQREERASAAMAFHSLEIMEGILKSAKERSFVEMKSTFQRPEPLPVNFPHTK
ncbi:Gfo/Idh/MocA family protein [Dethiobacter alkaliphilus]|uniref:Gfo/Idh/MocA family protein n=1 Tax=Dethiobacter alkaliphilus TaxID=427926 RepID=UPI002227C156|nr:Gfo/Idh/MocA family oxidoreductase [Dethiobacter alkaliphilus]MCW3489994.1 Gfo/Idh/MocA family oxidoreductase [Dethiobacter alkaliphilus]